LKLVRTGGLIAVDNVYWHGQVLKPDVYQDKETKAVLQLNDLIKEDQRVAQITIPIADGMTLCVKK
jgi:predicted O-methyltransferase YrrM